MESDVLARLRFLERFVSGLDRAVAADQAKIGQLQSQAQQLGFGAGAPASSAGGATMAMFYAPTGIPYATTSGTPPTATLSPGSATCYVATALDGSGHWSSWSSATVYNDYPNSFSTPVGVTAGHYGICYQDSGGNWRNLGEQC